MINLARYGFFETPSAVGDFLCAWAIRNVADRVLEPCAGKGALLRAAQHRFDALGTTHAGQIIAIEKSKRLAESLRSFPKLRRITGDFLSVSSASVGKVHAVVANPPFLRIRLLSRRMQDQLCRRFPEVGGRASIWAYFLAHARNFLVDQGRLAFVLPWQLVTTDYGRNALAIAAKNFASVDVLMLRWDVFDTAQVRTLLLLCEGLGKCERLHLRNVNDVGCLQDFARHDLNSVNERFRTVSMKKPLASGFHVNTKRLYEIARSLDFVPLCDVARVRVGTVTGCDSFFLLSTDEAVKWAIPSCCLIPFLAGPRQLLGLELNKKYWKTLRAGNSKCYLLRPCQQHKVSPELRRYLNHGKRLGVHQRFKCRTRASWFEVPVSQAPGAFLSYMSYKMPRLVSNVAKLGATNRIHYLTLNQELDQSARLRFAFAFLNHASLATAEIAGRAYGGGVLKLEPSSCARIMVPDPNDKRLKRLSRNAIRSVNVLLSQPESMPRRNDQVQQIVSEALWKAYGLTTRDAGLLSAAYLALRKARFVDC